MQSRKLLDWLALFDGPERRRLQRFVRSPYFNEHEEVARLLDVLLGMPDAPKEAVWSALFAQRPFDDLRLRHLSALLLGLCERFVAVERFLATPEAVEAECLGSLRERGAGRIRFHTARKCRRRVQEGVPGLEQLIHRFRREAELAEADQAEGGRGAGDAVAPAIRALDAAYCTGKLKFGCTILNNRRVLDRDTPNALMAEVLALTGPAGLDAGPLAGLYRQLHGVLAQPADREAYAAFRTSLRAQAHVLPAREAADLFALILNHGIGRLNAGEQDFLPELFGLYRAALEGGHLLQGGELSPWHYKNITVTGLRLGEHAWVEQFIGAYRHALPPAQQANAYTYNLARVHFHRGRHGDALRLLQQIAYDDVFYSLDAKVMQLKIYYAQGEVRALDALLDSFRSLLRRNRLISAAHRQNYLNLIRFVGRLSRVRPGDEGRIRRIATDLAACKQVADLGWLQEQVALLQAG